MGRISVAVDLEKAADTIADVSRADLQIKLRRAALMLRNVGGIDLDPKVDESLTGLAVEMGLSKTDLIRTIVGDWLIANAYLPVPCTLDEEGATEGSA
ncbi:hypothetical protein [Mesorhizobium sp. M0195]|uniref:hypothetical protein n=1 Tax=Mesorhizobium sp. M0195 TaxID=2956910 RepID=UPI00333D6F1F